MRKVFWDNPYQTSLTTQVTEVQDQRIVLAETIAFAFSGGQESDESSINGLTVIHSEIIGNVIYYTLPQGHGLLAGAQVQQKIAWPRRYRIMRLHFAAELIFELVTRKLNLEKIGAHIAETKARIDFLAKENISTSFATILAQYNQIIAADLPILTGFSEPKSQRRYWEISGFSKVACGGTHVKSTAEVGNISLSRVNLGSGKERIQIRLQDPDQNLVTQANTE